MQKKKNTRFKVTDLLVILVCLSGIGLNIVLFWNDLNRTLTKLTEKPIATVSYKYKAAQRKFLNRVLWDRLKQESPVYNGDIIRTADLSEARVTFPDGQFIELFENTLAQIFWNKKETFVDFSGGDISINSHVGKNAVVLSSGNNRVEVSSGGVLNAKTSSAGDALNVALLEGSGSITSSSGGTQTLDAGSALALLEDGTQEAVPMVAVLSPLPGAYVINSTQQSVPVNFLWKTNNFTDKEYVHIEVAEDSAFSRIVYSGAVRDKSQAEISVSSGIYWWRIYPVSENKTENYIENAASGKINVLYTPPPELITPTKSYVYHYRTRIPAVRFLWTAIEYTSAYKLDIADNPQMQNPKISRQLYDSSLVLSGLDAGTWYWKVTPLYPQDYIGTSQASPVSSFIIEQSGSLEPPVLAAPLSGSFVNIAKERADAYFSWKSEAEAVSYTIQISKNENLSNPIIKKDIKENWFLYKINQNVLQGGKRVL